MQLNDISSLSRYDWASKWLGQIISSAPSKVIWDIGAGDGRMRRSVESAGGSYYGFDLSPCNPDISSWDLDDSPSGSQPKAGGALLLDVVEHCNNPGIALGHVAEALVPGGFVILTTPNPRWSRSRLYALAKGTPICFTQSDLDLNHHVFAPWPHILRRQLADVGLDVEHYATLDGPASWPAAPFSIDYPLRVLFAASMKLIERFDSSACGMSYGFVARKQS